LWISLDTSEPDRDRSPPKQQNTQPQGRPHISLHDQITRDLKYRIGDREHRYRDSISLRSGVGDLENVVAGFFIHDTRGANVAAVQVVKKVDESAEWEEAKVDLSPEATAALFVFDEGGIERGYLLLLSLLW